MSLPDFKSQTGLFGIYGPAGLELDPGDRYRLFGEKIYPLLVEARTELEECYGPDNGRPSVESVLILGVTLWQFVEKVPDREGVERLRYHLGWKYALNHEMNEAVFDPTVLVRFRAKLLEHESGRGSGNCIKVFWENDRQTGFREQDSGNRNQASGFRIGKQKKKSRCW